MSFDSKLYYQQGASVSLTLSFVNTFQHIIVQNDHKSHSVSLCLLSLVH
jgi:hypothetical protein